MNRCRPHSLVQDVARGTKAAGITRKDIFITSKVAPSEQGFDGSLPRPVRRHSSLNSEALAAFKKTTTKLGTEYLDLYLIHWPGVQGTLTVLLSPAYETIRAQVEQSTQLEATRRHVARSGEALRRRYTARVGYSASAGVALTYTRHTHTHTHTHTHPHTHTATTHGRSHLH